MSTVVLGKKWTHFNSITVAIDKFYRLCCFSLFKTNLPTVEHKVDYEETVDNHHKVHTTSLVAKHDHQETVQRR